MSEADRKYRKKHLKKEREKDRKYFWEHREEELARNRAYYPKYYEKNKVEIRARRRNARHGVTQEWFEAKIAEQENRCNICKKIFESTPHIDHNHECCPPLKSCDNCRRDLLCDACNVGMGMFQDNADILLRAAFYITKHQGKNDPPSNG